MTSQRENKKLSGFIDFISFSSVGQIMPTVFHACHFKGVFIFYIYFIFHSRKEIHSYFASALDCLPFFQLGPSNSFCVS